MTFTLSIEDTPLHSFVHPYHLGTQEPLARQIAEERFHSRIKYNLPVVTVALLRDNQVVDVYDGEWSSQREFV